MHAKFVAPSIKFVLAQTCNPYLLGQFQCHRRPPGGLNAVALPWDPVEELCLAKIEDFALCSEWRTQMDSMDQKDAMAFASLSACKGHLHFPHSSMWMRAPGGSRM